jgi:hypothetical protein
MQQYKRVEGVSPEELQIAVNERINLGWKPKRRIKYAKPELLKHKDTELRRGTILVIGILIVMFILGSIVGIAGIFSNEISRLIQQSGK